MDQTFAEKYQEIWHSSQPWNFIQDVFLLILAVLSFFLGISLLIVAFRTKWKNQKIDMKLAIWLVIFDMAAALDGIKDSLFNLINYPWSLPNELACNISPFFALTFYFISVQLVAVVSMERCLLIVYKKEFSDRFYHMIIIILIIILYAICALTTALDGWGLIATGAYCIFDVSKVGGIVGALLSGALIGTYLFVIFFCYIKICIYRREQSTKAQIELGLDPVKVKKEVNSTIIKSLSIIIISAFTNGPYTLILFMKIASSKFQTPASYCIATVLINFNLICNTLILANIKPELGRQMKQLYGFKTNDEQPIEQ